MPPLQTAPLVDRAAIDAAYAVVAPIVRRTPLELSERLSGLYDAHIYLKREDLQIVRSYKIRGAFNRMQRLSAEERAAGVVCASAGNHAQGVAYSCRLLLAPGTIFMPQNTPRQKIQRVRALGGEWVRIELIGDTFDAARAHAAVFAREHDLAVVHPFDDPEVIAGQGTVAREICEQMPGGDPPEIVIVPVGGGGLLSGCSAYFGSATAESQATRLFGVEPAGAASLAASLEAGQVVTLDTIDTFVDGAAVQTIGTNTFAICQAAQTSGLLRGVVRVPEGRVCTAMIGLYQSDGIIAEPAGALSIAALDDLAREIRGKTVVCVISGGNNDISRYPEVVERSLIDARARKHYFLIEFSQRAGALRQYLDDRPRPARRHHALRVHQEKQPRVRPRPRRRRTQRPRRPRPLAGPHERDRPALPDCRSRKPAAPVSRIASPRPLIIAVYFLTSLRRAC